MTRDLAAATGLGKRSLCLGMAGSKFCATLDAAFIDLVGAGRAVPRGEEDRHRTKPQVPILDKHLAGIPGLSDTRTLVTP